MDKISTKTFWGVLGALFLVGCTTASLVWGELNSHIREPYHHGVPLYTSEEVLESYRELMREIKALRVDVQTIREYLIANGVRLR
tara:strand:- start:308 stop:562 length:255 start_codon:yes stop_codon:yes gene_type:complete